MCCEKKKCMYITVDTKERTVNYTGEGIKDILC